MIWRGEKVLKRQNWYLKEEREIERVREREKEREVMKRGERERA